MSGMKIHYLLLTLLLMCEWIPQYLKQLDLQDSWMEGLRSFCARLLRGASASDAELELEADRESESDDELVSFDESVGKSVTGGSCTDKL